jgi:MFS family permease
MSSSPPTDFRSAVSAATLSLVLFALALWGLLWLTLHAQEPSPLYLTLLGIAMGVTWVLHTVFTGIAARRAGRRAWPWVLLCVLTFPIGSIVLLILMAWGEREQHSLPQAR